MCYTGISIMEDSIVIEPYKNGA